MLILLAICLSLLAFVFSTAATFYSVANKQWNSVVLNSSLAILNLVFFGFNLARLTGLLQ
jgi:hypothetical protein